jgi:hypothetical protein
MQKFLASLFQKKEPPESTAVAETSIIEAFVGDPANPFLVSFPRTGSHWLRMVMELYFERPSLVRVFYYPGRHDYLTLHTHDMDLDVMRQNVIYLYREPVDTIYSQMSYEKDDLEDPERIRHWSDLYGRHLEKWLYTETFTARKTVIRYDRLRDTPEPEFAKICAHFGQTLDADRLAKAMSRVTKEKVKEKTPHDPSVITLGTGYEVTRQAFRQRHAGLVWETVLEGRARLRGAFEP